MTKMEIQKIYIGIKQSIMKNIPIPLANVNSNMTLIKTYQVVKNALMIVSDIVLLRPNYIDKDIKAMNYNLIS